MPSNIKNLEEKLSLYESNPSAIKMSNNWSDTEYENEIKELKRKISYSKRGKSSKTKGASFERTVAKKFEQYTNVHLSRTPSSGGHAKYKTTDKNFKGDIVCLDQNKDLKLHLEVKNQKTWALPKWFEQAEEDCPDSKIPCVVFHKHGTSKDYIAMPLEEFLQLVGEKIVVRYDNN